MTAMFAQKAGRPQSVMFFKNVDYLKNLALQKGIEGILQNLLQEYYNYQKTNTSPPPDFPVVAKEPGDEDGTVPEQKFYLIPILSQDNSTPDLKFLEVVVINPGNPDEMEIKRETPENDKNKRVGIAFVIDTTISMGPYIEASKEICNFIFKMVKDSGHAEDYFLAFIAFRSSLTKTPGLEYTTKLISDFTSATNQTNFDNSLAQVKEATVSSHSYNEDSIAGINSALDLNWEQFPGGGSIILITDAGPLDLSDPSKATKDSAATVFARAQEKKVHIVPIHLKTPGGARNHSYAEKNYRQMASQFGGSPTYIDLKVSNATQGATRYSNFMEGFASTMQNVLITGKLEENTPKPGIDEDVQAGARVGGFIGYSIYLNWLGQEKETSPASVARTWIPDKDMGLLEKDSSLQVPTVDICVLLSRNQLSALATTLTKLVDIGQRVIDNDLDFFTAILNSSLITSTDPKNFEVTSLTKLSELGVMEEFLEGLPYDSEIMTLTKADWDNMPAPAQKDFLLRLNSKIDRYQKLNDDLEGWHKPTDDSGEWLYRVPLSLLP
jgi:serine/threonine-protein kinase PpkA